MIDNNEKIEITETITTVEEVVTELHCSECGSTQIQVTGHCLLCLCCGWSMCGL